MPAFVRTPEDEQHWQAAKRRVTEEYGLTEADRGRFGCYAPPCLTQKWLRRWSFMEAAGDRWWPVCGAVYVVSAVRRVAGMRLITPAWKKQEKRRARRQAAVAGSHLGKATGFSQGRIGGQKRLQRIVHIEGSQTGSPSESQKKQGQGEKATLSLVHRRP